MKKIAKTRLMVHSVKINETIKIFLPTAVEWRQATEESHYIIYIKIILSVMEETIVDPKVLWNKRYVKLFH